MCLYPSVEVGEAVTCGVVIGWSVAAAVGQAMSERVRTRWNPTGSHKRDLKMVQRGRSVKE